MRKSVVADMSRYVGPMVGPMVGPTYVTPLNQFDRKKQMNTGEVFGVTK